MPVNIRNTAHFNTPQGWPDASNTGYRNAPGYPGSLTPASGPVSSGQTYSFKSYSGGLDVGASGSPVTGVTFSGCRFYGTGDVLVKVWGDDITFSYCSWEPSVAAPPVAYADGYQFGLEAAGAWGTEVQKLTVDHCDLWGFGNAIDTNGSTQAKPHVFRDNWVHDARADGGVDHTDGIGTEGATPATSSYVVIDHNTIESAGNTQGIAYQGSGVAGTVYDHILITNNLLGGFGFTVGVYVTPGGGTINNIGFSGNTYTTRLQPTFGPLYSSDGFTGYAAPYQWRNNRWHVPAGAAWGHAQYDGYFWLPGYTNQASPTLDELTEGLVGLSDYTG